MRSVKYYKKNGWVNLQFDIEKVDGSVFNRLEQPITLPVGFRPKSAIFFSGLQNDVGGTNPFLFASFYMFTTGQLQIQESTTKKIIKGNIVYYAGGGTE